MCVRRYDSRVNCPRCDAPLPDPTIFCPACGTRADDDEAALPAAPPAASAAPLPSPSVSAPALAAPSPPAALPRRAEQERPAAAFPATLEPYLDRMRDTFGYPQFRQGQAEVLRQLADSDVLGVMPTGGGKSLCYILPALEVGFTVVVSPLIALMQDQVEALAARGIAATFINSTIPREEQNRRYGNFTSGRCPLLFIAPERLANARFLDGLAAAGVRLFVVDEAHCMSEWGHDFRPDYLGLGPARARLGAPRTLALTATADPLVRRDIMTGLGISPDGAEVLTTFDRPNLRFAVEPVTTDAERLEWLVRYQRERRGQAGIVYARTRRAVEETAAALVGAGIDAAGYHAGMPAGHRAQVQRRFITGRTPVIVATNAFGLGIDKPDVRSVVHLHIPGRLEAYYQEAGRAGRDGEPAECTLLYMRRDSALQRRFIEQAHPDEQRVRRTWHALIAAQRAADDRPLHRSAIEGEIGADGLAVTLTALRASGLVAAEALRLLSLDPDAPIDRAAIEERRRYAQSRLAQMVEYAETSGCRRATVLRYFGEAAAERCDGCDNCAGTSQPVAPEYPGELFDDLLDLRQRLADEAGRPSYMVFEERTARELATYRPRTIEELPGVWGLGERRVEWFGEKLLAVLRRWEDTHPDAPPPPAPEPAQPPPSAQPRSGRRRDDGPEVAFDDPLFQRLRAWRLERSRREGVPAYTLFTDRTARELAHARPEDERALGDIWGLGDARIGAFGEELLEVIRSTS